MTTFDELMKTIEDYFNNTSTEDFIKEWDSLTDSVPVKSPLARDYLAYSDGYLEMEVPRSHIPNTWSYSNPNSQPLPQGVVFFCSIVQ